jgi:hypothetical protein
LYLFVWGSLITAPTSSRAEVIPWTVLLAILRPLANSLTPKPSLDEEMALRIAKAFFTEGAPYRFIVVRHNKLFSRV